MSHRKLSGNEIGELDLPATAGGIGSSCGIDMSLVSWVLGDASIINT